MCATTLPPLGHNNPPAIGHNNPPPDQPDPISLDELLDPELLRDQFALDYARRLKRRDDLLAAVQRFLETNPEITTEELAAKATKFAGDLQDEHKFAEAERERRGKPFRMATNEVQKFFAAAWREPLQTGERQVLARVTVYHVAKEKRERDARQAEAKRLQDEADKLARAAEASMQALHLTDAATAMEQAETAQRAALAKPAELSRTRADSGASSSLRKRWVWELTDLADVPPEYLILDEKKVNAAIMAGERDIPGLRIFEEAQTKVRR